MWPSLSTIPIVTIWRYLHNVYLRFCLKKHLCYMFVEMWRQSQGGQRLLGEVQSERRRTPGILAKILHDAVLWLVIKFTCHWHMSKTVNFGPCKHTNINQYKNKKHKWKVHNVLTFNIFQYKQPFKTEEQTDSWSNRKPQIKMKD